MNCFRIKCRGSIYRCYINIRGLLKSKIVVVDLQLESKLAGGPCTAYVVLFNLVGRLFKLASETMLLRGYTHVSYVIDFNVHTNLLILTIIR